MQAITLNTTTSDKEKMVEDVYCEGISMYFTGQIDHPFKCDGLLNTKTEAGKMLKLIMEFKYDKDFKSRIARAKVIVQVLYYLKRFENEGYILPNVILVGDVNECFVFHSNSIIKYLDENVDWTLSPSNSAEVNPQLVAKIANDDEFNPFIYNIDENFSFSYVAEKIKDLADNIQRYVHVSEHNIATIFEYFRDNVISENKKISANDLVAIFMGVIMNSNDYYLHPNKKNILVSPYGEISIKGDGYKSFIAYFNRKYTPQEKMKFSEISDRLIEDTNRRSKGEFYTPTLFVDYAHKMIAKQFGEDWKEKYVVWDNCWGTGNLTRDYHFKELYASTLENAELEIGKRYNPEAVKFQFDFLNDDLDKLPQGLINALKENKPIIFFINPPYGRPSKSENGNGLAGIEKGSSLTRVNKDMRLNNMGDSSANLQHQFMYRIAEIKKLYKLTNCNIALFSNPIYLSGAKQKDFLKYFCNEFEFNNGVMFQASHFANCSDAWGITFNLWSNGKTKDIHNFNHTLIDNINGELQEIGNKCIYNLTDRKTANDWAKVKIVKNIPQITLKSSLVLGNKESLGNKDIISWLNINGNSIYNNDQGVYLMSLPTDRGLCKIPLISENFNKCTSLFASHKLIVGNWMNSKDEYLAPNESHPDYNEFVNDSVIYSLFHSASNQSSMRNVEYKGKKWDIKNEFFFMSKEEIMKLAEDNFNDDVYNDARTANERFVYDYIQNHS
ncbi:MAG: hypothetical protein HUJ68_04020, partial [Clostridia bacterium]|nr:hypothetical protein [Clostridia bacterium]